MDIESEEFKFVFYSFVLIGGIIGIPYAWGYLTEPVDFIFTGMTLGVSIINTSTDWMNQAKEGSFLFTTNRTHEEVPAFFLNTLFLVMGLFSKFTGLSNIATYWLFYIIFMFGFFLTLYYFIAYFFDDPRKRKAAFIISLTSSGFGFIFWIAFKAFDYTPLFFSDRLPLGSRIFPIDLWLTDAITFLTLYSSYIQQVAGVTAMLLIFTYFLRGWKTRTFKYILYSGALTFLLGTFHLYDVVTVYAVLTVFAIITLLRKRDSQRLKMYAGYIAVSIPPMLFNFYAFALHPIFKEFTAANVQLSPNPYSYLLGLGLPLLLGVYYVYKVRLDDKKLLLAAWIGVSLALAYSPLTVQRKLQLGLNIPMAILAAYAIFEFVLPRFKERQRSLALVALILLMVPTNLLWIAKETYKVNTHGYPGTDYPYYTHNLDLEAIQWLGVNAGSEDVILSGGVIGGRIAGMVSKKVYWGGNDMTLRYQEKMKHVAEFFSNMSDRERKELLEETGISLVYYGVEERSLGDFNPDGAGYLRKVFDNGRVKIYRVELKNSGGK